MSLMDYLSQQLGAQDIDNIAQKIGASREQTESAIGMALPTLLGAMARKADDEDGATQLHETLQKEDSGLLDQLSGLLGGGDNSGSAAQAFGGAGNILPQLLGGRQARVEQGIGKAAGLDNGQSASLLATLAPFVMGALAKKTRGDNVDRSGLMDMLRGEKKSMENQASGGLLAGLLDQDGDGDFDLQDVMKLGMKHIFGRK